MRRVVFAVVVGVSVLAGVGLIAPAPVQAYGCAAGECYHCIGYQCELIPTSGKCECNSGGQVGVGRWCVLQGGNCYVIV